MYGSWMPQTPAAYSIPGSGVPQLSSYYTGSAFYHASSNYALSNPYTPSPDVNLMLLSKFGELLGEVRELKSEMKGLKDEIRKNREKEPSIVPQPRAISIDSTPSPIIVSSSLPTPDPTPVRVRAPILSAAHSGNAGVGNSDVMVAKDIVDLTTATGQNKDIPVLSKSVDNLVVCGEPATVEDSRYPVKKEEVDVPLPIKSQRKQYYGKGMGAFSNKT